MNISHGDTNLIVRYIQAFLQENYSSTIRVSGIYDEYTHEQLIKYLSKPNVSTAYDVAQDMMNELPEFRTLFNLLFSPTEVEFSSKTKSQVVKDFLQKDNTYNQVSAIAQSHGWAVEGYIASDNNNTDKYKVLLYTRGNENILPNRDLLPMINLYNNRYIMNFGIDSDGAGGGYLVELQTGINDDRTKLSYINVEPNSKYTIYHGYPNEVQITVASYSNSEVGIESGDTLEDVISIYLAPGQTYIYETPESANLMLIEIPWAREVEGTLYSDIELKLGDFNLDGNVDYQDLAALNDFLNMTVEQKEKVDPIHFYTVNFTNPVEEPIYSTITRADYDHLKQYLDGEISALEVDAYNNPITTRMYTQKIDNNQVRYSNVIGVTKGEYNETSIPAAEFAKQHWSIHDSFINYITLMAITKYSSEYDIRAVQQKLDHIVPIEDEDGKRYSDRGPDGIYTDNLQQLIKVYQENKNIPFRTGYVDVLTESEIDKDYQIMTHIM